LQWARSANQKSKRDACAPVWTNWFNKKSSP